MRLNWSVARPERQRKWSLLTVEVDVDGVQSDEEVTQDILLGLRDVGQEGRDDVLSGRELLMSFDLGRERIIQPTWDPTGINSFKALASTSPTSTPPSLAESQVPLL